MNQVRPSMEDAVLAIVNAVEAVRLAEGCTQEMIRSAIRHHLFDEDTVDKNARPVALKRINQKLGTTYSMTQVRSAPAWLPAAINNKPVMVVDELHGSMSLTNPTQDKGVTVRVIPDDYQGSEATRVVDVVVASHPAADLHEAASAVAVNEQNTQTQSAQEDKTMATENTVAAAEVVTKTAAENTTAPLDEATATARIKGLFMTLGLLEADGYKFFEEFLVATPAAAEQYKTIQVAHKDRSPTWSLAYWMDAAPSNADQFLGFIAVKRQEAAGAATLTGDRDSGIKTSWVGAAAAVIGGGLEMFARGGVNVVSALGVGAAGAASYFAGNMIDEHVESDFGRWVAAGSLGLALGAGASAVGRSFGGFQPVTVDATPIDNSTPAGVIPGL